MQEKLPLAPYVLLALAMIGLGDTFFLSYYQYLNAIPSCAIGGCEIVLTSAYSKFLGVPLSYIGLVYYLYLFCLSVLVIVEPRSRALRLGTLAYTAIGLGLSIYFEFYIQAYLIGALCMYCAISATTSLLSFGTAVWHWRSNRA
jgi:uncharacterized membrane protein